MDGSKNQSGKRSHLSQDGDLASGASGKSADTQDARVSIDQLKRLVQLIDQTDVSELELKRPNEGTRLVLRKLKASENNDQHSELSSADVSNPEQVSHETMIVPKQYIKAHLVGTFHTWAKPRGGSLVAVGDHVKIGQLVGTIESLNVINEVESTVGGRVAEILVQEGQPVEYGQHLIVLESSEEESGA
jgi:acetyl-CoA carboxylase biotin carboxyl carrier protein